MAERKPPCSNCGLRYSSYCIGCKYMAIGIGLVPERK